MVDRISRPPTLPSGAEGYLLKRHFQMAYVTSDLERTKALFSERFGLKDYAEMGGDDPATGDRLKVALAWAGEIMYELIQAEGPAWGFYHSMLPAGGGYAIRHHHLGFLVDTEEEWEAMEAQAKAEGRPIAFRAVMDGFIRALYVEAPELGHYLEYICPAPAGVEYFNNVPKS
jgi:catechol 2,3-dioxygenase-like lactoylglutathione lyase family enzyme